MPVSGYVCGRRRACSGGVGKQLTQLWVVEWGMPTNLKCVNLIDAIYSVGKEGKTNQVMRLI